MSSESRPPDADAARASGAAPRASEAASAIDTLDALQALELMLEQRHGLAEGTGGQGPFTEHDGQYRIPLLDEVLSPGNVRAATRRESSPTELSPAAQRLFERLASEIDVIVQSGIDEALRTAAKSIRARVKQHVSIVLPEILDELAHEDDRPHRR